MGISLALLWLVAVWAFCVVRGYATKSDRGIVRCFHLVGCFIPIVETLAVELVSTVLWGLDKT